jgi:hypothetical protein
MVRVQPDDETRLTRGAVSDTQNRLSIDFALACQRQPRVGKSRFSSQKQLQRTRGPFRPAASAVEAAEVIHSRECERPKEPWKILARSERFSGCRKSTSLPAARHLGPALADPLMARHGTARCWLPDVLNSLLLTRAFGWKSASKVDLGRHDPVSFTARLDRPDGLM